MRILLISSEPLLAELIAFRLELLSHIVDIAESMPTVMQRLENDRYSLLIIDSHLSDSDSQQSIVDVRNLYAKESLSILVVSVDPSLTLVEQLFKAGADDYLLAPFEPNILQEKIERLLSNQAQPSE